MSAYPTIAHAISHRAQQTPSAVALVHDDSQLSYHQMEGFSASFAANLASLSLGQGDRIALCVDRSMAAVAAMLGIFKIGGVFVPIDPSFPEDRIGYMLEDAGVKAVLCDKHYAKRFEFVSVAVEILEDLSSSQKTPTPIANAKTFEDTLDVPSESDLAYIMYTSGSTGKPKGVPISHSALLNYCIADADVYQLEEGDRTLQFSTLSFDIAVEEIFPPLMVGSTVVIRPSERSEAQIELSDIVEKYNITALHLATGYWHEWVDLMHSANQRVAKSIRLMVVTGEKVSPEHFYRWQTLVDRETLWANAYGPTEATVSATVFVPAKDWQGTALPIGKPLKNYTAYILNEDKQPVSESDTGELYIGGPSLANGYLNRPELTDAAFFPDPFSKLNGAKMYRTGDLARWMDDGNIEYAGRVDHQIKVGSFRIEPGEIENTINAYDGVKEVLVVADESSATKQLLAYVATDDSSAKAAEIADYLRQTLPIYMVPSLYVFLQNMPKTLNGKIDRKALPDASHAVTPVNSEFAAPVGDVQLKLCEIWKDVLGVPSVGVNDSFVSLGGDSLGAVRCIARMQRDLDFTVSTRDFFYLDTVALLSGYIEGKSVVRVIPAPVPVFINNNNRQLYTFMQPSAKAANGVGVLIVPPLGNEQRRSQRPFRVLMQNLARQGFSVMRFDWTGTGNSSHNSGDFSTIEPWRNDVLDAATSFSRDCEHIDIVSLRLGATIAATTDLTDLPIRHRIYWDPVLSGGQYLQEQRQLQKGILTDLFRYLRVRKSLTQPITEFAGLTLSTQMQESISHLSFNGSLESELWNHDAHVIATRTNCELVSATENQSIHVVDEVNDWLGFRSTTTDMQINQSSGVVVDILNGEVPNQVVALHQSNRSQEVGR